MLDRVTSDTTPTAKAAAPVPAAARRGSITLARHGEPALSRRVKLDAAGYRRWWAKYEEGGLLEGQTPPELLKDCADCATVVYSSTRKRAVETARAVCGDKVFSMEDLFIEAPLPPPSLPGWLKFSPRTWGVIARFWWWMFDHHEGQETRDQAKTRAKAAADRLVATAEEGRDVLVLAHGFFNGMVGVELTKRGWRCVRDEGFQYWSARTFERRD